MTIGYMSATNTYLPDHEASGRLVVGFARNQKDFAVNKVVKLVPTSKKVGYYLKFNPLDYNRLPASGNIQDSSWANGNPRPSNTMNNLGFEWHEFRTQRRNESVMLDRESIDLASWDVRANHTDALATLAMTKRAKQVYDFGTNTSNWSSTHFSAASSLDGGGFFSAGTATNPIIKISLNQCARQVLRDTNGAVVPTQLAIVMNPTTAHKMGETQEIHTYLKESQWAGPQLMASGPINAVYNLPEYLYGYKVIVDVTTYNGFNRLDSSEGQVFTFPDNKIMMYCQESKFEGSPDTTSFSTLGLFEYAPNAMKVETFDSPRDRITTIDVVDETDVRMLASESGFLITNVFS